MGLKSCLDDATEHCHSPNTKNNYSALASVVRPLHRKELSLPYIFCYRVQFASYLRLRHVNAYYLVAIIYKTAWSSIQVVAVFDSWEVAAFLWVGVVSALTVDTPPAFKSRECSLFLFLYDFDTLFHLLVIFLAFKFDWVVNNAFSVVWKTDKWEVLLWSRAPPASLPPALPSIQSSQSCSLTINHPVLI